MPNQYVNIGGYVYQPGSAAAKKAQELFNAMPQQGGGGISVPFPSTPTSAGPNFPSYPTSDISTTNLLSSLTSPGRFGAGAPAGGMAGSVTGGQNASLSSAGAHTGQGAYGLVPQMPNPISTALGAIGGNTGNLGALTQLGTGTTNLAANLAQLPYQLNLPYYQGNIQQAGQNTSNNLAGLINPQQWQQLQQHAGERGAIMGITPSSPNFNTALMTGLNQSILATQAQGQNELNAQIARTPVGQQFNIAGQQISPADVQAAQYQANVLGAAPDPTMAAQANLQSLLEAIAAGRNATQPYGMPQSGRSSSPGLPSLPNYGGGYYPIPTYGGGGTQGGTGATPYYGPTNPGQPSYTDLYQNPTVDYSTAPGGGQYPVTVDNNNLLYPGNGMDSSIGIGGQPYPTDWTDYFNSIQGG